MATDLLNTVGQIAGIGGIALGVFLILFRQILQKRIFPKLPVREAFTLLLVITFSVWSISAIGIYAWLQTHQGTSSSKVTTEEILAQARRYDELVKEYKSMRDERDNLKASENQRILQTRETELQKVKESIRRDVKQLNVDPTQYGGVVLSDAALQAWEQCVKLAPRDGSAIGCAAVLRQGLVTGPM